MENTDIHLLAHCARALAVATAQVDELVARKNTRVKTIRAAQALRHAALERKQSARDAIDGAKQMADVSGLPQTVAWVDEIQHYSATHAESELLRRPGVIVHATILPTRYFVQWGVT